jgi:hypothetical protein
LRSTVSAVILSTSFCFSLQAAEVVLCEVTNDIDKEVGKMVYEFDEESRSLLHLYKDTYLNNQRTKREELYAKDLLGSGIVLNRKDKYITVRMYATNFDEVRGGVVYLDTLYSGVSGERKEYTMQMNIEPGKIDMTYENKEFNNMHFIAKRSPILGVIGINKVQFTKK